MLDADSARPDEEATMQDRRWGPPRAEIEFRGFFLGLRVPRACFVAAVGRWCRLAPPAPPAGRDSGVISLPPRPASTDDEACRR